MAKATGCRHKVGVVRSVGDGGVESQEAWVRCERHEASVPLEQCRICRSLIEIQHDRVGRPTSVICQPEPANDALLAEPRLRTLTVGELMTRNVLCVRPELSLDAVMELFLESGFRAVPVVDDAGALIGLVSESDVLIDVYAQGRADGVSQPDVELGGERLHLTPPARTVGDVMTPIPISLSEHVPVAQAAAVMAFEGVYHITVLSEQGKVVGVLAAADILYRLAREGGYLLPRPQRVRP